MNKIKCSICDWEKEDKDMSKLVVAFRWHGVEVHNQPRGLAKTIYKNNVVDFEPIIKS